MKEFCTENISLCAIGEQFSDVSMGLSCVTSPTAVAGKIKREKRDEVMF